MGELKTVLFDLDGTLLDSLDDITNSVNYVLEKYGYSKRNRSEIRRFVGNGMEKLVIRSLPSIADENTVNRFRDEFKSYYDDHSQICTKPYEGITYVLKKLKEKNIRTGVVSNKPDIIVGKLCKRYFADLIDFSVGSKEGLEPKPSADLIKYAVGELGCSEAVYVGDSEVDILAAKNAGMPCVSVSWGFRDRDVLAENGAEYIADNAEELLNRLYVLSKTNEDV